MDAASENALAEALKNVRLSQQNIRASLEQLYVLRRTALPDSDIKGKAGHFARQLELVMEELNTITGNLKDYIERREPSTRQR